jgi:hypothetical protein
MKLVVENGANSLPKVQGIQAYLEKEPETLEEFKAENERLKNWYKNSQSTIDEMEKEKTRLKETIDDMAKHGKPSLDRRIEVIGEIIDNSDSLILLGVNTGGQSTEYVGHIDSFPDLRDHRSGFTMDGSAHSGGVEQKYPLAINC